MIATVTFFRKLKIQPVVSPGCTDARFVRGVGIPAIGFSPLGSTPILLHNHDEFIQAEEFLHGITIYEKILENLANV